MIIRKIYRIQQPAASSQQPEPALDVPVLLAVRDQQRLLRRDYPDRVNEKSQPPLVLAARARERKRFCYNTREWGGETNKHGNTRELEKQRRTNKKNIFFPPEEQLAVRHLVAAGRVHHAPVAAKVFRVQQPRVDAVLVKGLPVVRVQLRLDEVLTWVVPVTTKRGVILCFVSRPCIFVIFIKTTNREFEK